jgi:Cys-rich protein (TIGR01571 family)
MASSPSPMAKADWNYVLFGCCTSPCQAWCICLCPWLIPYCSAIAVTAATGDSPCIPYYCVCYCCCIGACLNRGKIRAGYNISGNAICDCLVHCFCMPCGICQEASERTYRTLEMRSSAGSQGLIRGSR